jgi:ATP-binding cassette subfamily C (CFTR/MRP) protein 1
MITSSIVEALVSIRRLKSFLNARELQTDATLHTEDVNAQQNGGTAQGNQSIVLQMKDATLTWDDTNSGLPPVLDSIELTVRKGELVGVLGRVGSGKVCRSPKEVL